MTQRYLIFANSKLTKNFDIKIIYPNELKTQIYSTHLEENTVTDINETYHKLESYGLELMSQYADRLHCFDLLCHGETKEHGLRFCSPRYKIRNCACVHCMHI